MADEPSLRVDVHGAVGRITLNRPDKRNPLGPTTIAELQDAFVRMRDAREVHAIVLTGAGPAFSAGGDLSTAMAFAVASPDPVATFVELFVTMHDTGKPIIAMVNGPALAGGLGLMVACDLVVAADTATFGTTEIAVGPGVADDDHRRDRAGRSAARRRSR